MKSLLSGAIFISTQKIGADWPSRGQQKRVVTPARVKSVIEKR
jgi:hypothetical protein